LGETREWLRDFAEHRPAESQQVAAAWAELFVAEGSDWFWWFSRRHDSGMDAIWDNQFRLHLRNVYRVVGAKPPARLFQPITDRSVAVQIQAPTGEISPQSMDDVVWEKAGRFEVAAGFGSLHRSIGLIETLLYGSDSDHLYLRLDSSARGADLLASKIEFWVFVSGAPASIPVGAKDSFVLPVHAGALEELDFEPGFVIGVKAASEGATITVSHLAEDPNLAVPVYVADSANPLFIKVPFTALEKKGGEPIQLAVVVTKDGAAVEQVPPQGSLRLRVPSRNSADEGLPVDRLRILIAAAEATPLAKSGNVADMTTWLAKELRRQGQDARLIMPRYRHISLQAIGAREVIGTLPVPLGQETVNCSIWEAAIGDVPVFLVDCPQFFGRDAMFGFGDDDARFIYFSRAVIEALEPLGFVPDVLHVNDWHTALIPNLLDRLYSGNPALAGIATVLTIHNLEFQGTFGSGTLHLAGLESWGLLKIGIPQLDDVVKLLGRGIHYSDAFNTVSERYAQEIQTPELGEGMDQMIKTNAHKLYGIVNGIDYDAFDPQSDAALPQGFSEADLSGKALAKAELRQQLGLPQLDLPLVVMISRLYETKGLDLIEQALPSLLEMKLQVAIMGAGDRRYEDLLSHQAKQNPDRLAVQVGFDPKLAQLMYGGGDMFLMPSRTEPCGLGQLIAVRYGTIPIVRSTGGLADTVEDVDPQANTGFGFVFDSYQSAHLLAATIRAAETYRHRRFWRELVRRAMSQDVSWGHSARRYTQLYRAAMMSHRERTGRASARAGRAR
jgi:starch synthase